MHADVKVPLREVLFCYCLTRDFGEELGLAALNLLHARGTFPTPNEDGRPVGLDEIAARAIAEVRALWRVRHTTDE